MTTGREELLPISIFACAEAMESIERFPLNPIEMEAGTDREIEGKSAPKGDKSEIINGHIYIY